MIFRPELAEKALAGEKTQTRRPVSDNPRSPWYREACLYKPGHTYALQPGRGKTSIGWLVVDQVRRETLGELTEEACRAEGFATLKEFEDYWRGLHSGKYDPRAEVWAVYFESVPF